MSNRSVGSLSPLETLELESGLSLVPRVKLLLTVHRADHSVKPVDEWQLKCSLIEFLRSSFSVTVPEEDIEVHRFKDLKKRKREEPVANGALFFRNLGFLSNILSSKFGGDDNMEVAEKKFAAWRRSVVENVDGIELNLEGVKFKLSVRIPYSDDLEGMRREWEEYYAFDNRGHSRGGKQQPDTIILRGVPSLWFAEPRVSSKPSMLVTHTILSAFGKIRNLSVTDDDGSSKDGNDDNSDIVSGLQCKVVVQYEKYRDFYAALRSLCGRSLQKQGSRLRADYELTWDKDGSFFRHARSEASERSIPMPHVGGGRSRSEAPRRQAHFSRYGPDDGRVKRFRE